MTRALLELYGMPAAVAEHIAAEYGAEWETLEDRSSVVVLEAAGEGECDQCHRDGVRLYDAGPADEGSWQECEPCIRLAAARRGTR